MRVHVEVTAADIVSGAPESESNCAVAIAMKRTLPGRDIEVWSDAIVIDGQGVKVPPEVVAFIGTFDYYRKPDPISFDLEVNEALA